MIAFGPLVELVHEAPTDPAIVAVRGIEDVASLDHAPSGRAVFVLLRASLPRLRYDQLMSFG